MHLVGIDEKESVLVVEPGEGALERGKLIAREAIQEVLGHAPQMGGGCLAKALVTGIGQRRPLAAPIVVARPSLDEALGDEAVDEPGRPRPREEQPIGELAHPQPMLARIRQLDEDVVVGEGHALLGLELALEFPNDPGVGAQEGAPGSKARVVARDLLGHVTPILRDR